MKKSSLPRQYARFLLVGSGLAVLCVALREVLFRLFPEGAYAYLGSVFCAYFICMALNYWISGTFVYHVAGRSWSEAARFFVVAIGTSLLVSLLAELLFRLLEWLGLTYFVGALSLAVSALELSLLSFSLNRKWVYRDEQA